MSESDIEDAQLVVMIRTLDSWFLLDPEVTYSAVTAWLESINVHVAIDANEVTEADIKRSLGLSG